MTKHSFYFAAKLAFWPLIAAAGCKPYYVCDEFPNDPQCKPLVLACSIDAAHPDPRIDLTQKFTIYAQDLRRAVLAAANQANAAPMAAVQLDYVDSADKPSTGMLPAIVLVPTDDMGDPAGRGDDELTLALTDEARRRLLPRRGGTARLQITLGRWTEALDSTGPQGCSFFINPQFSQSTGKFPAQRQGLSGSKFAAQLFTGRRTDCTGPMAVSCGKSSALYVSYVEPDPAADLRKLSRFTLDTRAGKLNEDLALASAFHSLPMLDRVPNSSVTATASQLILRTGNTKLTAMPAASASPAVVLTSTPPPAADALQGVYDRERFFLMTSATNTVSLFDLPFGASMATSSAQRNLTVTLPYRLVSGAQRPWPGRPAPDALVLSDKREVSLVCFDDLMGCAATQAQLDTLLSHLDTLLSQTDTTMVLDPVLADLDSDGLVDLVVLNRNSKKINWLPRLKDGCWGAPIALTEVPDAERFAVADMDGDGLLDLAILAANATPGTDDLFVLINQALPASTLP